MKNVRALVGSVLRRPEDPLAEFDAATVELIRRVRPYTLTSPARIAVLRDAVQHVGQSGIEGALVECGVWRGGSAMVMALAALEVGAIRDIWLYDTFDGMTPPTERDVDLHGVKAEDLLAEDEAFAARAGLDEVRRNVGSTSYPADRVRYVEGPVEETIPGVVPERIAVLRLDTDWYDSTRHELIHLWDRVVPGGIVIIDDYGHFRGAQEAVDEHFASLPDRPFLARIDYTGRVVVKSPAPS